MQLSLAYVKHGFRFRGRQISALKPYLSIESWNDGRWDNPWAAEGCCWTPRRLLVQPERSLVMVVLSR